MKKTVKNPRSFRLNRNAFSLIELMIASTVFLLAFIGILISYLTCLDLNEASKNTSTAIHASKARMEAIRNTSFDQIKTVYNNTTFTVTGLTGRGVTYVDDTNPRLLNIAISFSWRQPGGRIIGEDADLDGQIDAGEDKNSNGLLDSPVQIATRVFQ